MNKNGLKYFLNTLLSFYFLFSFIIPDLVQVVESHVGEIRHSILTRAQFRELYGEEWDLMQGQAIEADSELLQLWGKEHVPDARAGALPVKILKSVIYSLLVPDGAD